MTLGPDLWKPVTEPSVMVTAVISALLAVICSTALASPKSAFSRWIGAFQKPIVNRFVAWRYLFQGPAMIQDAYDKSHGEPFELFAPDNRYVFVSSQKHIKEVDSAPDTVLSLQAASKQMLQPRYTMHGFNWFDRRGTEGVGFIRALRTLLTNNLPAILPNLSVTIKTHFEALRAGHESVKGNIHSPVYPMILKLTVLTNSLAFFGPDLAKNEAFMKSALAYIEDTLKCAEIMRLLPSPLTPIVGNIIASRLKSHKIIFETLLPVAEQRVQERELVAIGQKVPQHADCIQWIMETSPKQNPWTAKRIVHELMAIWFGSVHALSTTVTFAIHDLCLHPEYVEPLRSELESQYTAFEQSAKGLPLLDSFIKESARITPVESMSTRRHALQTFTLSDGSIVNVGDWVCTPVKAMMQAPECYPSPLEFYGFRFAEKELQKTAAEAAKPRVSQAMPSKLTDVGGFFHVWGTGRMACPGRFYAAAVMKVLLAQVIINYDCELVDPQAQRWFTWRSSMLPMEKTKVVFTPR